MEKKNIRPTQANKGLVVNKKGQDTVTKTGQRNGYRREGNATGKPRDCHNRATPPRPKTQHLQKARGGHGFQRGNLSTDTENLDNDIDANPELYSVFEQGSKKQNLNHLLNFHYTPRERYNAPQSFGRSSRMTATQRAVYDKRQFLQANCQFLVRPAAAPSKYSTNIAFADTLVDWEPIEQIYLTTFEDLQCPICLFPPVACKITKCGHIYCWPCILHYLALSDKPWRCCPICHESVTIFDLKSAIGKPVTFSKQSDMVTFELKKRDRDSLIVTEADSDRTITMPTSSQLNIFSKIFIAEIETINEIVDREKRELSASLESQGPDCPESCFIQQALALLDERRHQFLNEVPIPAATACPVEEGATADNSFYFYQASDGQHMYLHAINIQMLEAVYGHIKHAPKSIMGKILEKESRSMDEGARKRYKFLGHLPLTCELDFVEIEFVEPVIPEKIIQNFQKNLRDRQVKRNNKERAENVRSKKIDEINNKQLGFRCESASMPISINLDSIEQFPVCVETLKETGAVKKGKEVPSFAKVMNNTPEQSFWPTLPTSTGGLQEFAASPPRKPQIAPAKPTFDDIDSGEELDRKLQEKLSIGGFIAEAIEKGATKMAKTKKKRKKGVPLLSTGMSINQ